MGAFDTDLIIENINSGIREGEQNSLATEILELQEEFNDIERRLGAAKHLLMQQMINAEIKTIKHKVATFTVAERKNIKVDAEKARAFLDSQGIYEEFSKIDDTKVKKIYPTAEFITECEPTRYLTIKGVN